ncbi:hypothetical protein GCM10010924_61700 [Rhizobium wenxiniae]|uniref:Uncharacterized protein n=1 Tax=Rhizobium wenxiniae TaxID=1737357 RepID=A0A7X0D328_9HYPH|nr:hypothetical protein [Rhizobium wenxiniae]GGG23808.1 hypothetical protein GCM10010924_61700 [Rhizobium wenxiniae]
MNYTPRRSADELFRSPNVVAGSDAEKLANLRKVMQLRKRELRDTERIRAAARGQVQSTFENRRPAN